MVAYNDLMSYDAYKERQRLDQELWPNNVRLHSDVESSRVYSPHTSGRIKIAP